MLRWLSLRMAYEHVRSSFGRLALSVLAIALGVALVVAIALMNQAVLASFLDTVDAVAGRAALTVSAGEGLTFPEDLADAVSRVPGVSLAVPLVRAVAFPDDGSGELLTVHGVDITHDAAVRVYHRSPDAVEIIEDPLVFLSQPDSIVLGREFADSRGLEIGSRIDLITPRGVRAFTVRGLLDPEGLARTLKGRLVVMDLFAAEEAFTSPGYVNQVDVLLEPGASPASVQEQIAASLPVGVEVAEPGLRKDLIRKTIGGFQALLTGVGLVAVLVGFIICYGRLGAILDRRTWEIGLLRAVGLSRLAVFGEMLKEALLLGVAGTAIGVPLGIATSHYGLPFAAAATAVNFGTTELLTTPSLELASIVQGIVVGLVAAVAAAILPALRLARKQPIVALRMRGREGQRTPSRFVRWAIVALIALISALLVVQGSSNASWPGTVVTGLVAVMAGVSAAPLVELGGRLLASPWQRLFGAPGEFAAGQIATSHRRVALTVSTLGIGLGASLMFGIVSWSFERSLVEQMTTRLRSDLVISSMFKSAGWIAAPVSEELVARVERVPGVAAVAAAHVKSISHQDSSMLLYGYDGGCFTNPSVCNWDLAPGALQNALAMVATGAGAIVSPSFTATFGAREGDTIRLRSPRGIQTFVVAGTTRTSPDTSAFISRDRLEEAWSDHNVTWTYVKAHSRADVTSIQDSLARELGERYRVQVRPVARLVDDLAREVHDAFAVFYLMEGMTLVLVLIAVGDLLTTGVLERAREIATMRAIGLRRTDLFAMVLQEGAAVAVLGLVLAAATGVALGIFWVRVQFPAILGWSFDLHLDARLPATVAAATLALCAMGSLLPALRAAHLPVGEGLRNE